MLKINRISSDYLAAAALHSHLNLFGFWDEDTFITKQGDPGLVLRVSPIDYESLDHAGRDHAVKRLEAALRILDERIRLYQILFKRNRPSVASAGYADPLVQAAIEQRMAYLGSRSDELFEIDIYYVLVREGSQQKAGLLHSLKRAPQDIAGAVREITSTFAAGHRASLLAEAIDSEVCQLKQRTSAFVQQLEDLAEMAILPADQAFKVLYRLLNPSRLRQDDAALLARHGLDYQLCDSQIEAHRGYLRVDESFVKVLTLKEPPAETWPLILRDLLEVKSNFAAVTEWKPLDHGKARKLIQSRRRHFHNSKTSFVSNLSLNDHQGPGDELVDDSKQAAIADLGECLTAIGHEGKYFGEFSLSIVACADDLRTLDNNVSSFLRVFSKHDGAILEERYNLLNAFFATVPGNWLFNLRRLYLLNTNAADLSFLFAVRTGESANPHLGSEYLAVLETDQATPYYLNLHNQDVAHTLILGATGSGKSFLLNFLIQNLQKYAPQTYIFDLGASFENLTRIFGGSYVNVGGQGQSFTINPFSLEPTKTNLDFLYALLKVLMEGDNKYELSGIDERNLYTTIERIYKLESQIRTMTNFAAMAGHLGQFLHRWTRAGQFGQLFDNPEDTLTLRPFQTFNFEATAVCPDVLEPLLFYILHRASSAIEDPMRVSQFKAFVMDEAWMFIRNATIRDYVTQAEKTWRKRNAAMILATQSLHELAHSEMLELVCESCPTKIFLANPDIDVPLYRNAFHFNDTELELLANLVPKRDLLLKNRRGAKKLHLNVDSFSYWMATNTPRDNVERQSYFERYGVHEGLTRLARDHPVESRVL